LPVAVAARFVVRPSRRRRVQLIVPRRQEPVL